MLETKNPYEVLGIKDGSSRDEVERRYAFLIKQSRVESANVSANGEKTLDMEAVNAAYRQLQDADREAQRKIEAEKNPQRPNAAYKILGINQEKANNFFYYHKVHIVITILSILVLVFIVKSFADRKNPDMVLTVIGQIELSDSDIFKELMKARLPEIKELGIDCVSLAGDQASGDQEYAMQMKAAVIFAAGDMDVQIMDRANFEKYLKMNAFSPLDEFVAKLGTDKTRYEQNIAKVDEQSEEHIYGVSIADNPILKQAGFKGNEMILTMSDHAAHPEKAKQFLSLFLK